MENSKISCVDPYLAASIWKNPKTICAKSSLSLTAYFAILERNQIEMSLFAINYPTLK